jgi:hypothetical protein
VDWLLTRETVITLAILAAILSVAASVLQAKQRIGPTRAKQLNAAGYALMGVSMLLFIIVGYRS